MKTLPAGYREGYRKKHEITSNYTGLRAGLRQVPLPGGEISIKAEQNTQQPS
jgi:hypothetical protein